MFPQVHPGFVGIKNRFTWINTLHVDEERAVMVMDGILKYDHLRQEIAGNIVFEPGDNGNSEMAVVPRGRSEDESDVYILQIIYNYVSEKSRLVIYDGQTLQSVATIEMERRIPMGFHSSFVSEKDLNAMDALYA